MNIRDAIGMGLLTAFIGALFILFFKTIPSTNEQIITYMIGQLSGFVGGVVSLHYVTKAGERELETQRADNTAAAFKAIEAAQNSTPERAASNPPQSVRIDQPADDPVPVEEAP